MQTDDARRLATALMQQHGLTGWRLVFDSAKTRAGICRFDRREIGLSRVLTPLHTDEAVRDTVLHEIAHALVGPSHGHDGTWRAVARRIGCSARRCVPADEARPQTPWIGTCPSGHVVGRHRRPTRPASCARCNQGFDAVALLRWTYRGRAVPMHPDYARQLEALQRAGGAGADGDVAAARRAPATPMAPVRARAPRLAVGATVRVTAAGRYAGLVGSVVKVGRTRYHLRTRLGTLTAPFAVVEPVHR